MSTRRLQLAAALAGLIALAASQAMAQDWRRVDYPEDGFSVEFSGEVQATPTPVDEDSKPNIDRSTDYLQDNDRSAYIVAATLARYSVDFANGVEASYGALKCKVTSADTTSDITGGQTRSVSGQDCGDDGALAVEARYFTVGKWFYQVLGIYSKGDDNSDARRFVESFTLLNR